MKHILRNDWIFVPAPKNAGRFLYHERCECAHSVDMSEAPKAKETKVGVVFPEDLERAEYRKAQKRENAEIEEAEKELVDMIGPEKAEHIADCCKPKPGLIKDYHSCVARDPKLAEIIVAEPAPDKEPDINVLKNNIDIVQERLASEEKHKDNPVAQGLWESFKDVERGYRIYVGAIPDEVLDYLENLTEEEKNLLRPCFNGDGDGSYLGIRCLANKNNKNQVRALLLSKTEVPTRGLGITSKAPELATIDKDGVISFAEGQDPSLDQIIPDDPKFKYLVIERTVEGKLLVDMAERREDGKYYYADNTQASIANGYKVSLSGAIAFEDEKEHEEKVEEEKEEKTEKALTENELLVRELFQQKKSLSEIAGSIAHISPDERLRILLPHVKDKDGIAGQDRKMSDFIPEDTKFLEIFQLCNLPAYSVSALGGDGKRYAYHLVHGKYQTAGELQDGNLIPTEKDYPLTSQSPFQIEYNLSYESLTNDPESEWNQAFARFEQRSKANQVEFLLDEGTSMEERKLYLTHINNIDKEGGQSLADRLSTWSKEANGKDFEKLFFSIEEGFDRYTFNNYDLDFLNDQLVAHLVFDPATTEYIQKKDNQDIYYFSKEKNEYVHWKTKERMTISGREQFLKISAEQIGIQSPEIIEATEEDRGSIVDKQKAKEKVAILLTNSDYRKNKIKNLNGEMEDEEFKKQNEEILTYYQRFQKHRSVHDHEHYEDGHSLALDEIGTANPEPNEDGTYDVRLHGSEAEFCYNPDTNEAIIKNRGEGGDIHFPMEDQSVPAIKLFSYLATYGNSDAIDRTQVGEEDTDSRQLVNRMNDLFPVEGTEYFRPGQMKEIANTLFYMKGKSFFWLLNHISIQKGNTTERVVNNDGNASALSRMEINQNTVLNNRMAIRNFLEDLGDRVIDADSLHAHIQQNNGQIILQEDGSLLQKEVAIND